MTMSFRNTNRRREKSLNKRYEFNEDILASGLSMLNGSFLYKNIKEHDQCLKELSVKIHIEYLYGASILMLSCLVRTSIMPEWWSKEQHIYCLRYKSSGYDE